MGVTLTQLRAFAAVAGAGSFSTAATELGITQPAVTHALRGLERELGGPLVTRRPDVALTLLGEDLLPRVRSLLALADEIELRARALSGRPVGSMRLGAVPTFIAGLMPQLHDLWAHRLPGVSIEVFEGSDAEMPAWLENGLVHASILVNPEESDPGSVHVVTDEMCGLVPRDHLLADQPFVTLADLDAEGVIIGSGGYEQQVYEAYADAGMSLRPKGQVSGIRPLTQLVANGAGVTLMPALGSYLVPDSLRLMPLRPVVERRLVLAPASTFGGDSAQADLVRACVEAVRREFPTPVHIACGDPLPAARG